MKIQEELETVVGGNQKTVYYHIDSFSCIRCGACAVQCPQDAIYTDDAMISQSKCNCCGVCMLVCSYGCIRKVER